MDKKSHRRSTLTREKVKDEINRYFFGNKAAIPVCANNQNTSEQYFFILFLYYSTLLFVSSPQTKNIASVW